MLERPMLLNNMCLIKTIFPTAKIKTLKALLPRMFPNAKSGLFNIIVDEILVINSGKDVTPANKIPPIKAPPSLVL